MVSKIKVFGVAISCLKHFQNIVFGTVLLKMGLLFRWIPENRGRQEQVGVQMIIVQILFVQHSAQ